MTCLYSKRHRGTKNRFTKPTDLQMRSRLPPLESRLENFCVSKIDMYMYLDKIIEPLIFCHLDSKLARLDSKLERLETRSFRVSRIEVRVESFKFQVTVNLHLTGTVCVTRDWYLLYVYICTANRILTVKTCL